MFRKRKPTPGEPEADSEWKPPTDPVFLYLLQEAMFGSLQVFYATVPTPRVKRFNPGFRPERTPSGEAVVDAIFQDWKKGDFKTMWVYPKGDLFIASDDYFTLAAVDRGEPDFVPCWVLGKPDHAIVRNVQGPMEQESIRKMLGVE